VKEGEVPVQGRTIAQQKKKGKTRRGSRKKHPAEPKNIECKATRADKVETQGTKLEKECPTFCEARV